MLMCQFPRLQPLYLFHAHELEWKGECCSPMYPPTSSLMLEIQPRNNLLAQCTFQVE